MSILRWASIVLLALVTPCVLKAADANASCAACHEDKGPKMAGNAHAPVACTQCHLKHEDYPHPAKIAKPACGSCHAAAGVDYARSVHGQAAASGNQAAPECSTCHGSAHEVQRPQAATFRKAIPETCGMCHAEIAGQYKESVHGLAVARGAMGAAVCTDCHGEHLILNKKNAASQVNVRNQRETCGQCHGNVSLARRFGLPQDRLTTFDASFHGLAAKGGSQTLAGCASCHGIHDILPSANPKSAVSTKNLPQTCGKCHAGAGARFALGPIHVTEASSQESPIVGWVRLFYLLVIPGTIGFMLIHNGGDWLRKVIRLWGGNPLARGVASGEIRMLGFERLCHALLASSFIVLAWTGFALKYPDQWWASPLLYGEPQMHFRRNIHRIAAVIMIVTSFLHVFALIFSHKQREHWMEMLPKWRDVTDAIQNSLYNVGLRRQKPTLPSHGYIEKLEYWAVVWGTFVMVATGLLLWNNSWTMKWLPKWVMDVSTLAHWFEAILATLAILVWHFYSVIFDPDVYPIESSWLTGRASKRQEPTSVPASPMPPKEQPLP